MIHTLTVFKQIGEVGEKIRAEEAKRKLTEPVRPVKSEPEPNKKPNEKQEPANSTPEQVEPIKTAEIKDDEKIKFNKPTSSLDLERDWRSMSQRQKAAYLRFIDDASLTARCFTSQLPKYIVDICSVLSGEMSETKSDARLAHELLKQLSQVPRFSTTMFFLLDNEKAILKELIDKLKVHVNVSDQLSAAYTAQIKY